MTMATTTTAATLTARSVRTAPACQHDPGQRAHLVEGRSRRGTHSAGSKAGAAGAVDTDTTGCKTPSYNRLRPAPEDNNP